MVRQVGNTSIRYSSGRSSAQIAIDDKQDEVLSAQDRMDKSLNVQQQVNALSDAFGGLNASQQFQWAGASGVLGIRQYTGSVPFDPSQRVFDTVYAALNVHDHPNYKSMSGLGEVAVCMNGIYFRGRHNDYRHRKSIQGSLKRNATEHIHAPELSERVLKLPTGVDGKGGLNFEGDTQARYLKSIFKENPQDLEWHFSYAELWLEEATDKVPDAGDSFRHSENDVASLSDAYSKSTSLIASGHKDRLENVSIGPVIVAGFDEDDNPVYANPVFRIMSKKVGDYSAISPATRRAPHTNIGVENSHSHQLENQMTDDEARDLISGKISEVELRSTDRNHNHIFVVVWDKKRKVFIGIDTNPMHQHEVLIENGFSGNIPFNEELASAGTVNSRNRFSLVRDLLQLKKEGGARSLVRSKRARFRLADLDRICEMCPGLDGEGSVLMEEHTLSDGKTDTLLDRDGGTLNAAYYNRRYQFSRSDASGRATADRGFNDPNLFVAKTANPNVLFGYSYMLPIEMLLRSPVENWNPLGIPEVEHADLKKEAAEKRGDSEENPMSGMNPIYYFNTIPAAFYEDVVIPDPADTARLTWVTGEDSKAHLCWSSGTWVFNPDKKQRMRFPIYPVAQEFSYESVQLENFKGVVRDLLKSILQFQSTSKDIDEAF